MNVVNGTGWHVVRALLIGPWLVAWVLLDDWLNTPSWYPFD